MECHNNRSMMLFRARRSSSKPKNNLISKSSVIRQHNLCFMRNLHIWEGDSIQGQKRSPLNKSNHVEEHVAETIANHKYGDRTLNTWVYYVKWDYMLEYAVHVHNDEWIFSNLRFECVFWRNTKSALDCLVEPKLLKGLWTARCVYSFVLLLVVFGRPKIVVYRVSISIYSTYDSTYHAWHGISSRQI